MRIRRERASATVAGLSLLVAGLALTPTPARAQVTLPFSATYTGIFNATGPDPSGNLFVTSTQNDPLASFGLTQGLYTQIVNVFANPNTIVGTSIFQTPGGAGNALFTSYFGTGSPINPPLNFVSTGGGTFLFTGGSGVFAGATGGGTWTVSANLATNAVTTSFVGTVTTAVPEPGSCALVGVGFLAFLSARRPRRTKPEAV